MPALTLAAFFVGFGRASAEVLVVTNTNTSVTSAG
jgi:hypothetical protein